MAGSFGSVAVADPPGGKPLRQLVLEKHGSFFINGETIETDYYSASEVTGRIVVNQMYAEYWIPQSKKPGSLPVVMLHGSGHTGKTYGETPDGREG